MGGARGVKLVNNFPISGGAGGVGSENSVDILIISAFGALDKLVFV